MLKKISMVVLVCVIGLVFTNCSHPMNLIFKKKPPEYSGGEEYSVKQNEKLSKHIDDSDLVVDGRVLSLERGWIKDTQLHYVMKVEVHRVRKGEKVNTVSIFMKDPKKELGQMYNKIYEMKFTFYLKTISEEKQQYRFFKEPNLDEIQGDPEW